MSGESASAHLPDSASRRRTMCNITKTKSTSGTESLGQRGEKNSRETWIEWWSVKTVQSGWTAIV